MRNPLAPYLMERPTLFSNRRIFLAWGLRDPFSLDMGNSVGHKPIWKVLIKVFQDQPEAQKPKTAGLPNRNASRPRLQLPNNPPVEGALIEDAIRLTRFRNRHKPSPTLRRRKRVQPSRTSHLQKAVNRTKTGVEPAKSRALLLRTNFRKRNRDLKFGNGKLNRENDDESPKHENRLSKIDR